MDLKFCYILSFNLQGGRPPRVYLFDHRPIFSPLPDWIGAIHGIDIAFVFGAPLIDITDPFLKWLIAGNFSETEKGLSLYVMKLWTDFAKYG